MNRSVAALYFWRSLLAAAILTAITCGGLGGHFLARHDSVGVGDCIVGVVCAIAVAVGLWERLR